MKVGIKTVFVALFLGLLMSIIAVLFYGATDIRRDS